MITLTALQLEFQNLKNPYLHIIVIVKGYPLGDIKDLEKLMDKRLCQKGQMAIKHRRLEAKEINEKEFFNIVKLPSKEAS